MIAVKRLQSLFWLLLVALGALAVYLVSLRVATERNAVNDVRAQIARARADIRYLETEFSARANIRQLERWNEEDYRYSTPSAAHYLDGERSLANLEGVQPNGPAYVAPPVMVAMVEDSRDLPSASIASVSSPAVTQIRSDVAVIRTAEVVEEAKQRKAETAGVSLASATVKAPSVTKAAGKEAGKSAPTAGTLARKAERMAMLDARLLDDGTLGDLGRKAAAENRRGNN